MMDRGELQTLIHEGESRLVELKREWFDLDTRRGSGKLVKEILALSNAAEPGQEAFIIVGVEDQSDGGGIQSVEETPDADRIQNILNGYTSPTPTVAVEAVEVDEGTVNLIRITETGYGLYFATQDVDNELSSFYVYTRRQGTTARMTPHEFQEAVREQAAGRRGEVSQRPLKAGFVDAPGLRLSRGVGIRVVNVTEEPVEGVHLLLIATATRTGAVARKAIFGNPTTLYSGDSLQHEQQYRQLTFMSPDESAMSASSAKATRGLDLELFVHYRNRDGFYEQFVRRLAVGD